MAISKGDVFGRLTVVSDVGTRYTGGAYRRQWACRCECGAEVVRLQQQLVSKRSVPSCGCVGREFLSSGKARRYHAHAEKGRITKTYRSWQAMRGRCYRKTDINYPNYGGRGVCVCDSWMSFDNFLRDMGECPSGGTIERRDVNGHYSPENCYWIPKSEQSKNRRGVHVVLYDEREWIVSELAKHLGITPKSVRRRIARGALISHKL